MDSVNLDAVSWLLDVLFGLLLAGEKIASVAQLSSCKTYMENMDDVCDLILKRQIGKADF